MPLLAGCLSRLRHGVDVGEEPNIKERTIMKRLALALAAAAIAGCSGNAGSVLGPMPQPGAPLPSGAASSAQFVIKVPASTTSAAFRKPMYISPSTKSIAISANGGAAVTANLTPGSPGCVAATSNTPLTCTVSISAPTGTDTFTLITYDGANGTGNKLSTATVSALIAPSPAQNVVPVVLNGIVSSIQLVLSNCCPPADNTPHVIKLTVNAMDADGNVIVGPGNYANPITLSDSDTSGHTKLSTTMLNSPTDASAVTVLYDGSPALKSATFCASASGVTPANVKCATLTPSGSTTLASCPATTGALTGSGNLYVSDDGGNAIDVYAAGSSGNVTPLYALQGSATLLYFPGQIALDSTGCLYVHNRYPDPSDKTTFDAAVLIYAPGAKNNAAPVATIGYHRAFTMSGKTLTLHDDGLALDAVGNVDAQAEWDGNAAVAIFSAGSNDPSASPARDFATTNSYVNSDFPSMAVDTAGYIYLAQGNEILAFSPIASGVNAVPDHVITVPAGLGALDGIFIDAAGRIYAVAHGTGISDDAVLVFAAGASGSATPIQEIKGPHAFPQNFPGENGDPGDVTVDSAGNIYVAVEDGGHRVSVFASGSTGDVAPTRELLFGSGGPEPEFLALGP